MSNTWIWVAAAAGIVAAITPRANDLILYNHSPSMPVGLYLRTNTKFQFPLARGVVVTVRAGAVAPETAAARHFDGPRNRFIKHVAAITGDRVCAQGDSVTINHNPSIKRFPSKLIGIDKTKNHLIWVGCRDLAHDEVLLLGETPDSFDGRYWGPVSVDKIEGVWRHL